MKVLKRFALLGILALMWFGLSTRRSVQAQGSCNNLQTNLFASSCETQRSGSGGCYSSCDARYGYGTSQDTTCRTACDRAYQSCLNQNQGICGSYCGSWCGQTTGETCCAYVDQSEGCSYTCGCLLSSKPDCSPLIAQCDSNGGWTCNSPILIDVNGDGFQLTSIENGVWFDLADSGRSQLWSWTAPGSDDGFLALDRNGDGMINDGTELFGSVTPQPPSASPNGFLALAVYDKPENGGNGDGFIDSQDAIYSKLRIWIDKNHDGVSQPNELHSLSELGIGRIDLQYQVKPRIDQYGNGFALRSRIWDIHGNQGGRWAWDVYLRTQ